MASHLQFHSNDVNVILNLDRGAHVGERATSYPWNSHLHTRGKRVENGEKGNLYELKVE